MRRPKILEVYVRILERQRMRMAAAFFVFWGSARPFTSESTKKRETRGLNASRKLLSGAFPPWQNKQNRGNVMKKLLLIALVASGLFFVLAQSSDAQVYVGIPGTGVGVSVGFGYPAYGYYLWLSEILWVLSIQLLRVLSIPNLLL